MSVKSLYRWSGVTLLVGALLSLASSTVSTFAYPGDHYTPQQLLSAEWAIGEVVLFVGLLLICIAFPAGYLLQAGRAGRVGFAGFVLLWLGLLGALGFSSTRLAFWPYLAQSAPQLLPSAGGGPAAGALLWIFGPLLLLTLGNILLGIATLRAGVFPRAAGILLIMSAVVSIASLFLPSAVSDLLDPVSDAALFLALGWFGLLVAAQKHGAAESVAGTAATIEALR